MVGNLGRAQERRLKDTFILCLLPASHSLCIAVQTDGGGAGGVLFRICFTCGMVWVEVSMGPTPPLRLEGAERTRPAWSKPVCGPVKTDLVHLTRSQDESLMGRHKEL